MPQRLLLHLVFERSWAIPRIGCYKRTQAFKDRRSYGKLILYVGWIAEMRAIQELNKSDCKLSLRVARPLKRVHTALNLACTWPAITYNDCLSGAD